MKSMKKSVVKTETSVEQTGLTLGKKISKMTDAMASKINVLLKDYGLEAKVLIQLTDSKTGQVINI